LTGHDDHIQSIRRNTQALRAPHPARYYHGQECNNAGEITAIYHD